jgi:ornithine cyclodeaminase/alanine dehydrogenase-like protein (mu-crystallin family)
MPLTILSEAQVRSLLLSLTRDDVLALQQNIAEALREYSTGSQDQGCAASYQPQRTAITRKDGTTTVFMPASTGKTTGIKIISARLDARAVANPADAFKPGCSIGQDLTASRQSAKVALSADDYSSRRSSSSLSTDMGSMSLTTTTSSSQDGSNAKDDDDDDDFSSSSFSSDAPSINHQSLNPNTMKQSSMGYAQRIDTKGWIPAGARDSSPRGALTLLDEEGLPFGLVSAQELTAFRTALTSLCVFNKRKHVKNLTVFGAGRQAYWHIRLALLLRGPDIKRVYIINRSFERAAELLQDIYSASNASWRAHVKFSAFSSDFVEYDRLLREAVRKADAIFCCTPSLTPLFPAECLTSTEGKRKGRLISAIGSYKPHMTELHPDIFRNEVKPHNHSHHHHKHAQRGGVVLVDSLELCLQEAGEIVQAELKPNQLVEIGELMIMKQAARLEVEAGGEVEKGLQKWLESGNVVYKSVGLGLMDLVTGGDLVALARERGVGTVVPDF